MEGSGNPEMNGNPERSDNPERSVIGIDLGTTRCCVAIVDDTGKVQTIQNDLGNSSKNNQIFL